MAYLKKQAVKSVKLHKRGYSKLLIREAKKLNVLQQKLLRNAIEEFYETPFRLLVQLGGKKSTQIKRKIARIFKNAK